MIERLVTVTLKQKMTNCHGGQKNMVGTGGSVQGPAASEQPDFKGCEIVMRFNYMI
jgi:hypothetical protein